MLNGASPHLPNQRSNAGKQKKSKPFIRSLATIQIIT
jgi:hypothetical protein